ncbi:hypothetical protein EU528_09625 [Candidatus Thorarchaeota archaeon]|nr:MAG: hypothetical protein EU528_09625 [Candidatus Thorarchaeota archaeon]
MNTKKLTLIFLFLLASQILFISFSAMSVNFSENNNIVNLVEEQNYISETDLNRVETRVDAFENGAFESWDNPHQPSDLTTSRDVMIDFDLEVSIVSEGARSGRLMAMGTDVNHPAGAYCNIQSWSSPLNPTNLTVSFDYYIDLLPNPQLGDRLELVIPFNTRYIHYNIGSTTNPANTSTHVYCELDVGALQTWNTFDRNVTQDYIDAYGILPTQLDRFVFYAYSYDYTLTRVYIDDVNFVNSTNVIVGGSVNGGDFEVGYSGSFWYFYADTGLGDISQSTTRVEGDWSLNTTAVGFGNEGECSVYDDINRRLTSSNKDEFTFSWNIADWQVSTSDSRAYSRLYINNMTSQFFVYYLIGFGGTTPTIGGSDDIVIFVDDFNTTGTWNLFNQSVFDDVQIRYPGSDIEVSEIAFYATATTSGSKVTVLYDDVSFVTSIIHDEGYEDQGDIGNLIYGWDTGFGTDPSHTVTDFTANGDKAANITIVDDDEMELYQELAIDLVLNENTEIILDMNWYIDTLNVSSSDYLVFILNFDGNSITLPIMNTSVLDLEEWDFGEEDAFLTQPETNTIGEWVNWQIDIVHTFEDAFGELPDTTLSGIDILGFANVSSSLIVIMDDLYIYYDSAPEITQVTETLPLVVEVGVSVEISAEVIDATERAVTLSYRADSGIWTNVSMPETAIDTFEIEFNVPWGVIEYFVTATDAFGKTDIAMDGSEYFAFTVIDTIAPVISLAPANESSVSEVVSIEINVTDTGSGFAGAELFIEGTSIANITEDSVTIFWNTTAVPNGEYNITVVAEDNAGNTASVSHLVTVENTTPTTTTTTIGGDVDPTGVIVVIIMVAAGTGIIIIYIIISKKR